MFVYLCCLCVWPTINTCEQNCWALPLIGLKEWSIGNKVHVIVHRFDFKINFLAMISSQRHEFSSTQVAPYPHFNICLCLHCASFAISTRSPCCTNITQLLARPLKCTWHWRFSLLEYQHVFALQKTRKQALKRCPNWWNFTTKGWDFPAEHALRPPPIKQSLMETSR